MKRRHGAAPKDPSIERDAARLRAQLFLIAVFVFLVAVIPATALGEDTSSSGELSQSLLQKATESQDAAEAKMTNPQAAEELPHDDLGRQEAVELTEAVFEPVLQTAAGPLQDLEVEKYLGDNAALVTTNTQADSLMTIGGEAGASGDSEPEAPVLLESTIPLLTEDPNGSKGPVNLELESAGDHFEPKAPLVEVELPKELGAGINLPESGIGIKLADAPSNRAPSLINEDVATYVNVADDTDFSAVPSPAGLETMSTLRSPSAPKTETLRLSLPPGASLREDHGGAEVTRGERSILQVLPPSAIDANGTEVPVTMTVSEDELTMTVAPNEDTAYPILLDPLIESHDWYTWRNWDGMEAWHSTTSNYADLVPSEYIEGLAISAPEGPKANGDQAGWYYYVPRLKEEETAKRTPTSYIARMTLWHLSFLTSGSNYSPYISAGILGAGHWAGTPGHEAVWGYGGNYPSFAMNPGYEIKFENGEPGKRDESAKMALGLGMSSVENVFTPARFAELGSVSVEVADEDKPLPGVGSVSPWMNQTATTALTDKVEDTGLGVKSVGFEVPGQGVKTVSNSCLGTAASPCPEQWTGNLPTSQYNPAALPEGFNHVPITAEDVVGNKATPGVYKATIRVDHTAPSLSVSGPITEQGKLGTSAPQYALKYSAIDGFDEAAAALAPFGTLGSGNGQLNGPCGIASDKNGHVWVVDRANSRVEEFNEEGQYLSQFGSAGSGNGQFKEPKEIAISPAGNIWISDPGNKRVQEFSSSGGFIRKISYGGFVEPFGVATGPGETLWVSDLGAHALFQFQENGTFIRQATGSASNHAGSTELSAPLGVATDSKGDAWVVDNGYYRLQEFDPNGKFLMQFGSSGSEAGQLKTPVSIAIAPSGNILVSENLNNRIQEFQPNGTYLRQFGSAGSGNANLSEPRGVAFGAGNIAFVSDKGHNRVVRWSHADLDPQSGVSKIEIKVDGKVVKTPYNKACAEDSCQASGEWIFNASEYTTGVHKVEVVATDGVNLPTISKPLEISTINDTTPPQLSATSAFFGAPEGWLEQKTYTYNATATDPGGSGVKSVSLKIDGKVVKSVTQPCLNGGCSESLSSSTINMATYAGGAHPAELIATDVANHTATKKWTINVDPKGVVPAAEATDTMEAFEETAKGVQPVSSTPELLEQEEMEAGDNPSFHEGAGLLQSAGVPTETWINLATEAVTIEGAEGTLQVIPTAEGTAMTTKVEAGVAAVAPSVSPGVDTVVRPEYNGALFFTDIREPTSPQDFTWRVPLEPGETLKADNEQFAEVDFKDGTELALITAEPAHDATGAAVPTHLEVTGSEVTLVVSHHAGSYVYPIVAGQSFEVGYSSVEVIAPPPPEEELENGQFALHAPLKWVEAVEHGGSVSVPAPEYARSSSSQSVTKNYFLKEICSRAGCDKFKTLQDGYFFKYPFEVERFPPAPGCEVRLGTSPIWPHPRYIPSAEVNGTGWNGPEVAAEGDHTHLVSYCHFTLEGYPEGSKFWTGLPKSPIAFLIYIWGNGFVQSTSRAWDPGIVED